MSVNATGVITVGALIGMAAHLEGKGCTVLDFTGLAQKNGAVMSHIRLAPKPEDLHAVRIAAGGANLILGCDMVVAAAPAALSRIEQSEGAGDLPRETVRIADLLDAVTFEGLWNFLGKHPRMSWEEIKRSFSKELFCASLQRLVPEIREDDLEPGGAGVRAQAMSPDGTLVQDFCLVARPKALHVLNAPSPAATASLAIGEEIARRVAEG